MKKKTLATVWLAGCSGCHMSLLDIDERILEVLKLADIVKSPIVDGKEFPEVDIALVEGAIGADEHYVEILHIREKAKILVSLGDCAVSGNVASMRNYLKTKDVLSRSYEEVESNDSHQIPNAPEILRLVDRVRPLHEVVDVDYFIPGCPPSADTIFYVLNELLNDRVPDLATQGGPKHG
jgi:NAD-reducing hydrogenase small subunit